MKHILTTILYGLYLLPFFIVVGNITILRHKVLRWPFMMVIALMIYIQFTHA